MIYQAINVFSVKFGLVRGAILFPMKVIKGGQGLIQLNIPGLLFHEFKVT